MENDVPPQLLPPILEPAPAAAKGPWGFWATLGLSLAVFAVGSAVSGTLGLGIVAVVELAKTGQVELKGVENSGLLLSLVTIIGIPIYVGLTWLLASLRSGRAKDYLGLKSFGFGSAVRWAIGLIAVLLILDRWSTWMGRPDVPDFMVDAYRTASWLPLLWFGVCVGAPICEEFLFRGFFFTGLLHSRIGKWGTILLTSTVWAAIHLQYEWPEMLIIFAVGVLLGYARWKTGSVYLTIFLHALMNTLATFQVAALEAGWIAE